ncbi:MAG: XRE family transcriptional regulator [Candidatus Omnitrophica bacterium]|nr:XRE family transcriptional regulator [Candidatus Omnitrophota bacterium]
MLIGKRIKEIRKQQKISLTELSKKSGIQLATLSRIENLKMTGTLESHIEIAKALNVEITELYQDISLETNKVDVKTEESSADFFNYSDRSSYEILTNKVLSKKMMPILLRIEPNGKTNVEQGSKSSEKFLFVLEGSISAKIGDNSHILKEGNTLYFDASLPHYFENTNTKVAKVICVATPVEL